MSPRPSRASSRCRASSSSGGSRGRRTSSTCSIAFCGDEQLARRTAARDAWRGLQAARRRYEELTANAAFAEARLAELSALVEDTEGMESDDEERLRGERERLRHVSDLATAADAAATALAPDDGDGASGLVGLAERAARAARAHRPGAGTGRRQATGHRTSPARDGVRPPRLPVFPRSRARQARAAGSQNDRIAETQASVPLRDVRGASRARGRGSR